MPGMEKPLSQTVHWSTWGFWQQGRQQDVKSYILTFLSSQQLMSKLGVDSQWRELILEELFSRDDDHSSELQRQWLRSFLTKPVHSEQSLYQLHTESRLWSLICQRAAHNQHIDILTTGLLLRYHGPQALRDRIIDGLAKSTLTYESSADVYLALAPVLAHDPERVKRLMADVEFSEPCRTLRAIINHIPLEQRVMLGRRLEAEHESSTAKQHICWVFGGLSGYYLTQRDKEAIYTAMADISPVVRVAACESLATVCQDSLTEDDKHRLAIMVYDDHLEVRLEAVRAIGQLGLWQWFEQMYSEADITVREEICRQLARSEQAETLDLLWRVLEEEQDPYVRAKAGHSLFQIKRHDHYWLNHELLPKLLDDLNQHVCLKACELMKLMGPDQLHSSILQQISSIIDQAGQALKIECCEVLAIFGDTKYSPIFYHQLLSVSSERRASLLHMLDKQPRFLQTAKPQNLLTLLNEEISIENHENIYLIRNLLINIASGETNRQQYRELANALRSNLSSINTPQDNEFVSICWQIVTYSHLPIVTELPKELFRRIINSQTDSANRAKACYLLGLLAKKHPEGNDRGCLRQALFGGDVLVKKHACRALALVNQNEPRQSDLTALYEAYGDMNASVRGAVCSALAVIGRANLDDQAQTIVRAATEDTSLTVRLKACRAYCQINQCTLPARMQNVLCKIMLSGHQSGHDELPGRHKLKALKSLLELSGDDLTEASHRSIIQLADDDNPMIRQRIMRALEMYPYMIDQKMLNSIKKLISNDNNDNVRIQACRALAVTGDQLLGPDERALLRSVLQATTNCALQTAVMDALWAIGSLSCIDRSAFKDVVSTHYAGSFQKAKNYWKQVLAQSCDEVRSQELEAMAWHNCKQYEGDQTVLSDVVSDLAELKELPVDYEQHQPEAPSMQ